MPRRTRALPAPCSRQGQVWRVLVLAASRRSRPASPSGQPPGPALGRPAQPPQEPALQQLGVEPVGFSPGDAPAIPRHSRHGSHAPPPHAPSASAPTRSHRGRLRSWSKATRDLLKSFGWGIRALHQLATATMVPSPRRLPIPSRRWREMDSNPRSPAMVSSAVARSARSG
jgi:hypothetical protein